MQEKMQEKEFGGISNQTAVVFVGGKTVSLYANVTPHESNSFESFDKKGTNVKWIIHEKEKGITVSAVMELNEIRYLMNVVQSRDVNPTAMNTIRFTKVFPKDAQPVNIYMNACQKAGIKFVDPTTVGPEAKCTKCRKILITYQPFKKTGEPAMYPWTVQIKNGMAIAEPVGSFGQHKEKEGSFAQEAENYVYLSQCDIYNIVYEQINFFQDFEQRIKSGEIDGVDPIVTRVAKYNEWQQNREYRENGHVKSVGDTSQKFLAKLTLLQTPKKNKAGTWYCQAHFITDADGLETKEGNKTFNFKSISPNMAYCLNHQVEMTCNVWREGSWWYAEDIPAFTINQVQMVVTTPPVKTDDGIMNVQCVIDGRPCPNLNIAGGADVFQSSLNSQKPFTALVWTDASGRLWAEPTTVS